MKKNISNKMNRYKIRSLLSLERHGQLQKLLLKPYESEYCDF